MRKHISDKDIIQYTFTEQELNIELKFDDSPEEILKAQSVGYEYKIDDRLQAWHGISVYRYFKTDKSEAWENARKFKAPYSDLPTSALEPVLKFYKTMADYWYTKRDDKKIVHYLTEYHKALLEKMRREAL